MRSGSIPISACDIGSSVVITPAYIVGGFMVKPVQSFFQALSLSMIARGLTMTGLLVKSPYQPIFCQGLIVAIVTGLIHFSWFTIFSTDYMGEPDLLKYSNFVPDSGSGKLPIFSRPNQILLD